MRYIIPLILLSSAAFAQDIPPNAVPFPPPASKKIVLELTEQQAQALVGLIDDGVKVSGLAKAETAAILFNMIKQAATAKPKE